jgi:hypothetical protein
LRCKIAERLEADFVEERRVVPAGSPLHGRMNECCFPSAVILPLLGLFEKTKPLPNSISESVLRHGVPTGASAPPPPGAQR